VRFTILQRDAAIDAAVRIEVLSGPAAPADCRALAHLLIDALESGAGVSFLLPLPIERAEAWWRQVIDEAPPRSVVLVARDAEGIAGTVQLQPAWAPNQPHRADVAKLIVHRRARGTGVARALMMALEREARAHGFTLLVLDTVRGSAAEGLYAALGWERAGVVPDYALSADGSEYCDTVIFYKRVPRLLP
jgi:GNAT superfamily N-acetyltransferase